MREDSFYVSDDIIEGKENENMGKEIFCIDSADKANWAIEKIKEERERFSLFEQVAKNKIAQLEQQINEQREKSCQRTGNLLKQLDAFLEIVPAKKTKTQYSFELPAGKLVRKLPKLDYQKDEKSLLEYLTENDPLYVKIDLKILWNDFKKKLTIIDNKAIRIDTGEQVECISIVEKPESFDVL